MSDILGEALARHRRERPDDVALAEERRELRYGELAALIDARRRSLDQAGAQVIAIELDNGIEWVLWDLAAAGDRVCVPVPPFFTAAQRDHVYESAGVDTAITARGMIHIDRAPVALPAGTARITFTSGTTGTPKGVCLPWDGLHRVAASLHAAIGATRFGRHLCALPLGVLLENVAGVYTALLAGCRIELPARAGSWMSSSALLSSLAAHRANTVILVPELLRGLVEELSRSGRSLPHLEFAAVGGARVSAGLIARARALGLPVHEGYGLSECGSVVSLNTPTDDRPGSVGRVLPHVEVAIEDGEITIANPVALGYVGGGEFGTLRTGDLGELDADGFLAVHGRRKNVLITSYARNISPEWPEAELLSQRGVLQAVVCGDGWPQPGALIVAAAGMSDAVLSRAVDAANRRLPEYARIGGWLRVAPFTADSGQLTANGRPRRRRIIETHIHQLELKMKQSTFYDRLVAATSAAREELYRVPQLVDGLNGRISRATYTAYLTEAYHHVRHTVPFLMSMGAHLPRDRQWLQDAIIEYINEEKGHEQWILADIDAAGGDSNEARQSTPRLATEVLIAYNYDYIRRRNPVGFLGMVFMLESTSTQIAIRGASSIQKALDLPDAAFSYLYSHGTLDQEHMRFFRELVERVTDEADQAAIIEVANNTFRLFAAVLGSIPHGEEMKDVA